MTDLELLAAIISPPGFNALTGHVDVVAGAAQSKANVLAIAAAAGLPATAWVTGDPSERWAEIMGRAFAAYGPVDTMAARQLFLKLQTDPGDAGDLSTDQTPRPGFLSALGSGWFGTTRGEATRATVFVTVTNGTANPITFAPYKLTFSDSDPPRSDGGQATYRNTAGATTTSGVAWPLSLDGSITIATGATAVLSLVCDQVGTYGSTSTINKVDVLQTTSFGVLTIVGSTKATGTEREARDAYIDRCLLAPDANAPGGPGNAYRRAGTTMARGAALQRYDGTGPVAITKVLVSPDSSTGDVTLYFAGPSGAVSSVDVRSANANIIGELVADPVSGAFHNPAPLGVVPDTVVLLPGTSGDPGGYGGVSAIDQTIAATYSVFIKAGDVPGGATPGTYTSGGSPPAAIAAIFTAIAAAISSYLPALGPGALDPVGGTGYVYTADLAGVIKGAFPGLYAPGMIAPGTATTAVLETHVPVAGIITGAIVVKP